MVNMRLRSAARRHNGFPCGIRAVGVFGARKEAVNVTDERQTRISILRHYQPSTCAKISGATMVASDSTMNFGVSIPSLPHVIFSFGTAPE